ncbi:MAG: glycoside hydrolase family 19 protein, partial [Gammaproteobacteria bacterium]|nr:glycoside hydrolase family 19 protein [Gammaproteobacteria bacterium]
PELLESPKYAALSAGWFWNLKKLNQYADDDDFETMTRRISGGLNGLDDRQSLLDDIKQAMA